jgi:hypothetical protein
LRSSFSDTEDKSWKATWFVTSREDVGDFYVVVRESGSSKSMMEKDVVYSERSFRIHDLKESSNKYELCVLARDSEGNVKHYRNSQCRILSQHSSDSSGNLGTSLHFVIVVALLCTFM